MLPSELILFRLNKTVYHPNIKVLELKIGQDIRISFFSPWMIIENIIFNRQRHTSTKMT